MKRPPIVTTRDARLSLWTSLAESLLKAKNPDLSAKEIKNLPMMRGVYAHVSEADGKPVESLEPAAKTQMDYSKKMYELASNPDGAEMLSQSALEVLQGKRVSANVFATDSSSDDTREFSDADYKDWAIVAVAWVAQADALDIENMPWYEKALYIVTQGLGITTTPSGLVIDITNDILLSSQWLLQSSDTKIQEKFIKYNKWNNNQSYSLIPWTLPNDARVVMLGDWGTSLDDAKQLLKAVWAAEDPHAFVHLGDIYYSGTKEECQDNFLNVFKTVASELGKPMVPIFTIPGNHEYYSFGEGFFWLLDNLNSGFSPSCQQPASYFCLRTADNKWQFLAMDTGQDDNNPIVTAISPFAPKLMGDRDSDGELAWHVDKLKNFPGQTILMSHHQLFSRAAAIDDKVTPYFSRYLHSYFSPYFNKIAAWFWGHEHSYAIYPDGIYGLSKGRLLGSSSYEVPSSNDSSDVYANNYPLVPYAPFSQPGQSEGYYDHVCAVLDFKRTNPDDAINVKYYSFPSWGQDDSTPSPMPSLTNIYNESIGASTMKSMTWSGNNKIKDANDNHIHCKGTPAVCNDSSYVYISYRNDGNDHLYFNKMRLSDNSWGTVYDTECKTKNSPGIVWDEANAQAWLFFSDDNDSRKLSYIKYQGVGDWSDSHHIKDGDDNHSHVNSGISAAWIGSTLYLAFVEDSTNQIKIATYSGGDWSFSYPTGSPKSNFTPGLTSCNGVLYLVYADKNDSNKIKWMSGNGSSWTSKGQPTNEAVISSKNKAMAVAHDNISLAANTDGHVTACYRGEGDTINWLTYDTASKLWYGGVSLPRIGSDKDVPMTTDSAGVTALSNGLFICFHGKSDSDIRWVQRKDS